LLANLREGLQLDSHDRGLRALRILVVDDDPNNVLLLKEVLARAGYHRVDGTTDPSEIVGMFAAEDADLVLLDLHMPDLDGFELMRRLGPLTGDGKRVPILALTADRSEETKRRALAAGARDFVCKPFDQAELLLRVRNLLQVRDLQKQLHERNLALEVAVARRTRELEQARLEILARLALAAEYRDDATQQHAWRIGRTSARLAARLRLDPSEVELINRAAPLHDIGKIGIPDAVLLKAGALTTSERCRIQEHTTIGAEILSGSETPVLRTAEQIALTHHERWDGRGYPHGLHGQQIPLVGQIVAVADVFDALTHDRPYKAAWPVDRAVGEIHSQAGRQFDPRVVEAFSALEHRSLVNAGDRRRARPRAGRSPTGSEPENPPTDRETSRTEVPA
jgi:putative two-component system response regulator